MPQPIRRQLSLPLKFEKEALEQRPSLARYIAQVSAAWTDLECSVGLLLAIILDTEAKTGVHMYLALSGSAAQVHVLTGAAEAKLSQALQDELSELLKEQRNRAAERNRIVHALWATAPEYPDGIINCPPDNFVRDITNLYTLARLHIIPADDIHQPSKEFMESVSVYQENDFQDVIRRIESFRQQVRNFYAKVLTEQARLEVQRQNLVAALRREPRSETDGLPRGARQINSDDPPQTQK
jgi:hypothetical protein